jgi:hypothetical protein
MLRIKALLFSDRHPALRDVRDGNNKARCSAQRCKAFLWAVNQIGSYNNPPSDTK